MKKITLLLFLLTATLGFAQQQIYNLGFEPGTPSGTIGNWTTFEATTPPAQILANPDPGGVNTSPTTQVMQLNVLQAGDCFAGVVNFSPTFGTWNIDTSVASNLTFSMDVNKNIIGPIGIKMATTTNGTTFDIPAAQSNTIVNDWETLTWDLTGFVTGDNTNVSQVVVYMDFRCGGTARPQDVLMYIDNISFGAFKLTDPGAPTCTDGIQNGNETGVDCGGPDCGPCSGPTAPTVAAPVPTPLQSQVINMYSNTYGPAGDVAVSSWRSDWSTSTYTNNVQVAGAGSETKRYIDADFVGVEFYSSPVDATSMNYFHVDVWTPNATTFRVKLVDLDNGVVEGEIAYPNFTQGQWVSLDIPLDDFADPAKVTNPAKLLTSRNSIQQLIFSGLPTGTFDFYIDNVYFSTVAGLGVEDFDSSGFNVYPNPSQSTWTIKGNNLITSVELYDVLGKQVLNLNPNSPLVTIDASDLSKGLYFVRINSNNQTSTVKLIKN